MLLLRHRSKLNPSLHITIKYLFVFIPLSIVTVCGHRWKELPLRVRSSCLQFTQRAIHKVHKRVNMKIISSFAVVFAIPCLLSFIHGSSSGIIRVLSENVKEKKFLESIQTLEGRPIIWYLHFVEHTHALNWIYIIYLLMRKTNGRISHVFV